MSRKIFKFKGPDGEPEFKYQDDNGQWVTCDENGNALSNTTPDRIEPEEMKSIGKEISEKKVARRSNSGKSKGIRICLFLSKEQETLINDYVSWKSLRDHVRYCRSDLMAKAMVGVIRRDSEFMEYIRSKKL